MLWSSSSWLHCISICIFILSLSVCFFFFNDTATTEIYTLSLHDALPTSDAGFDIGIQGAIQQSRARLGQVLRRSHQPERSEEHTSELQSQSNLVCRLLLEKKKATD